MTDWDEPNDDCGEDNHDHDYIEEQKLDNEARKERCLIEAATRIVTKMKFDAMTGKLMSAAEKYLLKKFQGE